jgi:hypothetical protein
VSSSPQANGIDRGPTPYTITFNASAGLATFPLFEIGEQNSEERHVTRDCARRDAAQSINKAFKP